MFGEIVLNIADRVCVNLILDSVDRVNGTC